MIGILNNIANINMAKRKPSKKTYNIAGIDSMLYRISEGKRPQKEYRKTLNPLEFSKR